MSDLFLYILFFQNSYR